MDCSACGGHVKRGQDAWLFPGWPNTWNTQTSIPFHRACIPGPPDRAADEVKAQTNP